MMRSIILISVIILLLLLLPTASARSSQIFIDHLTNLIWDDCKGNDIRIHQPVITLDQVNHTISLTKLSNTTNQITFLSGLRWPYSRDQLKQVIQMLTEQPYRTYQGQCDGVYSMVSDTGFEGCGILTSGKNKLNINFDTYYWNGEKVDVPKEELYNIASGNNNTQVINKGDKNSINIGNSNIANTGENSTITQQDLNITFSKGIISGAIVLLIAETLGILLQRWLRKKKKVLKP